MSPRKARTCDVQNSHICVLHLPGSHIERGGCYDSRETKSNSNHHFRIVLSTLKICNQICSIVKPPAPCDLPAGKTNTTHWMRGIKWRKQNFDLIPRIISRCTYTHFIAHGMAKINTHYLFRVSVARSRVGTGYTTTTILVKAAADRFIDLTTIDYQSNVRLFSHVLSHVSLWRNYKNTPTNYCNFRSSLPPSPHCFL